MNVAIGKIISPSPYAGKYAISTAGAPAVSFTVPNGSSYTMIPDINHMSTGFAVEVEIDPESSGAGTLADKLPVRKVNGASKVGTLSFLPSCPAVILLADNLTNGNVIAVAFGALGATAENDVTIYELDGVASDFITFNP